MHILAVTKQTNYWIFFSSSGMWFKNNEPSKPSIATLHPLLVCFLSTSPTLLVPAAVKLAFPHRLHGFKDQSGLFYHAKYLIIGTLAWISGVDLLIQCCKGYHKSYTNSQICVFRMMFLVGTAWSRMRLMYTFSQLAKCSLGQNSF